jgi:hypothetical protein
VSERRRGPRRGSGRGRRGQEPTAQQVAARAPEIDPTLVPVAEDAAARHSRTADGPHDLASYNCQCGLIFAAPVSTTVGCPHCGSEQAW